MYFSDIITLCKISETPNTQGYLVSQIVSSRDVYAEKHSLARGEFYGAAQAGIEVTTAFKMYSDEYDDEQLIKHKGKSYKVIRTFDKNDGYVDITCTDARAVI